MSEPWFQKRPKLVSKVEDPTDVLSSRMEGLWIKCDECSEIGLREELEKNQNICPTCGHHFMWPARKRIKALCDPDTFEEFDKDLLATDPLGFSDSKKYRDRLKSTRKALEENDAFISGFGVVDGRKVAIGCFLFEFMGGSMGSVVGEKITRLFERALEHNLPVILFSSSGGARMQEGIFSLMQMAKTCAALAKFRECGKPYISVLLHPTTGGVAASFSWLGDIVIAEPKAQIGFAGPRVIEQTIRQKLPPGFQRSEFLLEKGMIDAIVPRGELRSKLSQLLGLLADP